MYIEMYLLLVYVVSFQTFKILLVFITVIRHITMLCCHDNELRSRLPFVRTLRTSLVPRPFLRGWAWYILRMRLVPKISGNLDTPRILSVFPNSNPSFYVTSL